MLELLTQEDLLTSQYRACSINKTRHIFFLQLFQNVVNYHKIHISKKHNFTPSFTGGGALWTPPPVVFCILLQKSPLQPMMKLYVNSYTILVVNPMLWSGQKNLIFAHFKASKGRRVQNRDFCTCQFRVLRGIFWGLFMNQKLFRIKKY